MIFQNTLLDIYATGFVVYFFVRGCDTLSTVIRPEARALRGQTYIDLCMLMFIITIVESMTWFVVAPVRIIYHAVKFYHGRKKAA